ncbi:MAG TPA: hypothetical protein VNN07_14055, partial [Candidatus Tectomicrobia bacterium]|nr:hypothetical protein [Candidatus Tectomicrobia bacterium]
MPPAAPLRGRRRVRQAARRLAVAVVAVTVAAAGTRADTPAPILVTIAEVAPTAATLWARASGEGSLVVELADTSGTSVRRLTLEPRPEDDRVVQTRLERL